MVDDPVTPALALLRSSFEWMESFIVFPADAKGPIDGVTEMMLNIRVVTWSTLGGSLERASVVLGTVRPQQHKIEVLAGLLLPSGAAPTRQARSALVESELQFELADGVPLHGKHMMSSKGFLAGCTGLFGTGGTLSLAAFCGVDML